MQLRSRQALVDCIDARDVSERQVARDAGLGHSTVNHLVTGRRRTCSLRTALAIERALDCAPGALFAPDTDVDRIKWKQLWATSATATEPARLTGQSSYH
jgi:DNA-binding Xre family transcriptional regulator